MHRRQLLECALGTGIVAGSRSLSAIQSQSEESAPVVIERNQPGKPHKGKVLAAIQPLAFLGDDDETANREYIRRFLLKREEETGRKHGLRFAEPFHYIGPPDSDAIEAYIKQNATPL